MLSKFDKWVAALRKVYGERERIIWFTQVSITLYKCSRYTRAELEAHRIGTYFPRR